MFLNMLLKNIVINCDEQGSKMRATMITIARIKMIVKDMAINFNLLMKNVKTRSVSKVMYWKKPMSL